ncbi:hypothetical protein MBANPS3_011725 [Mucor bainieri]
MSNTSSWFGTHKLTGVLRAHDLLTDHHSGEKSLRGAAKRLNAKLYDEQRRESGPNIDIIFARGSCQQEVAIMELSGPVDKQNHTHFLEDRVKIAINLKHMLKFLIKSMPHCSLNYIQALKLYGFQIHYGIFYIYSMRTYDSDRFTFNLEHKFSVPLNEDTIEANSPGFFSKLWIVTI